MLKKVICVLMLLTATSAFAVNWGVPMVFKSLVAETPYVVSVGDNTTLTSPVFAVYRYTFTAGSKTLTLGETGVYDGQHLCIYNPGSNSYTVADDTGGTQVLTQYTEACYIYQSDRWIARTTGSTTYSGVDQAANYTFTGTVKVTTVETASICADSAGDAACTAAPAGSVVVDAADTTTVVSTTAVTANSQIFLQVDSSLGTRLGVTCNTQDPGTFDARITARTAGTSFTITLDTGPTTNPLCLSYLIVN